MKVSHRLLVIVLCTFAGLAAISIFALNTLHNTMLEDRRKEIFSVLNLAAKQVEHFQEMERQGALTHEEAEKRAIEALSGLRDGKSAYIWARTEGALSLVHPNQALIGKVDFGKVQANGKTTWQNYLDRLAVEPFAYFDDIVARPGSDVPVAKINGLTKIPGWNWLVGFGIYVDDVQAAYNELAIKFLSIGLLILVAVMAIAYQMSRSIYRVLGGEPAYAAKVANGIADGDLRLALESNPLPGSLMAAVAQMQSSLRGMIQGIQQAAEELGGASSGLRSQMNQIDQTAQHTSDATTQTAAAVEEMSMTISQISESAQLTHSNSERSERLAVEGERLVDQVTHAIEDVSSQVNRSSDQIAGLHKRTGEIDSITGVIKNIASQTNLLALNAAIEAARAGEYGRGFAVVADEVRQLAQRTAVATEEITTMIADIQQETSAAVEGMSLVSPKVAAAVSLADQAAGALRDISRESFGTLEQVRGMAHATSEHSQASASVAQNVERIANMVQASAGSVTQANGNVSELTALTGRLRDSAARFRL